MRIKFESTSSDVESLVIIGEGTSVLACMAHIEKQIEDCTENPNVLAEDTAIDWGDCFDALLIGESYQRMDFSSSEQNFRLSVIN